MCLGLHDILPAMNQIETDQAAREATGADKGCARSFPVKIENGRVYLDMNVAAKA